MRRKRDAPVDKIGLKSIIKRLKFTKKCDIHFAILGTLILSSQSRDECTACVVLDIDKKFSWNPNKILKKPISELRSTIRPIGLHRSKSKRLYQSAKILMEKYNGCLPNSYEKILEFPGVGVKVATLYFAVALNKTIGITVDTHVHRISNRLKWITKTKVPHKTKIELEDIINKNYWKKINPVLVGFGQQICLPRYPKCCICLIKNKCDYYSKNLN